MEIQTKYYTYCGEPEEITEVKHPLTWKLIQENNVPARNEDTIYDTFIREFYFVEQEFQSYKAELTPAGYNYSGINIYLEDCQTLAFQINQMF